MRVSGATGVRDHNVILTRRGPVVTDWCNAGAGDPAADVAMTMVTVSSADVPGLAARLGRELLLRGIRGGCRTDPAGRIQEAVRAKLDDPNPSPVHWPCTGRPVKGTTARRRPMRHDLAPHPRKTR
ncbi:phosphotransferase [Streptomyces sp. NPDC086835]|uniref:phosphotransferase n=1 Tax=Streptomyces sp. NPDC086835 TaxID=3365761 RepID=UPI003815F1F3